MISLEKIVKSTEGEVREVLEQLISVDADLIKKNRELEQIVENQANDIKLLKRKLFGASSERMKPEANVVQQQMDLFNEFELCAQELTPPAPIEEDNVSKPTHKKPGRKRLPKNLPRTVIEHDLSEEDKSCACGKEMEVIGATTSEELDYQPAKLTVVEHRCLKYGCEHCNNASKKGEAEAKLKAASKPKQLIPKSFVSAGLLSQIVTQKFCDHLPLYRQETIFNRLGVKLSRQTMSQWVMKLGEAVIPLCNLLTDKVSDYDIAFADETTVQVLKEPGRKAQTKSYMWCFVGGPPEARVILYQYHPSRSGDIPNDFFEGFKGAIHCDAYAGYNNLIKRSHIIGINCMSHVRRKFFEALPNGKEKGVSGYAIKLIRKLYKIEENLRAVNASPEAIKLSRIEKSEPLLKQFKQYLDEKSGQVPPQSPVGKAITYTRKCWPYLTTYLLDGRYEIDNLRTERAIRPFAMGRNAWLFANSVNGAHTSARLFSLIETAKANGLAPDQYLLRIVQQLPYCVSVEDYEALLPWHIKDVASDQK